MPQICAYCGSEVDRTDRDHVFPSCLYPKSKSHSHVQRLTIPACKSCNNGWSDDEAHFRNVMLAAGEPNSVVHELLNYKVKRSFTKVDGRRRFDDLVSLMKPVVHKGKDRHMIYPAEDPRILRIVRKIIRGLCHHHGAGSAMEDGRVWVDILRYRIPEGILDQLKVQHREHDICRYRYDICHDRDANLNSAWLITFFERTTFIGVVSECAQGFVDSNRG